MSRDEVRATFLRCLAGIAPDADLAALDPRGDLREQLEIDSFDLLTLMVRLSETMGVDVPEADYGRMKTLDDAVDYLTAKAAR